MKRIVGLDIGEKRVGLAVAEQGGSFAVPAGFLEVRSEEQALGALADFLREEEACEAVLGLPLNMDGSESAGSRKVRRMAEGLKALAPGLPLAFWDERLTSYDAESMLKAGELKFRRKKGRVDAVAASLILQGYLDSRPGRAA